MPPTTAPITLLRAHFPNRSPLLPLLTLYHPSHRHSHRQKSSKSKSAPKGMGGVDVGAVPAQQSAQVSNKLMLRRHMPNDLGLLLGTLIEPKGLPNLLGHPMQRTKMEVARVWKRAKDLVSVLSYKFVQKPRLKIHFRKTAPLAAALHRQMYTALADGDTTTLHSLTCEGLHSTLTSRISQRPRRAKYVWTLHSYTSPPRVVSHRGAILPIDDGSGHKTALRQAVVRIASVQTLERVDEKRGGSGAEDGNWRGEEEVQRREVVEYVVVQRRVFKGVEEKWRIWGTTEPTDVGAWEDTLNPRMPVAA